jgi:hypothetical protein
MGAVALFAFLLWQGPWWLDRAHLGNITPARASLVSGFRTAVVAVGAGVIAVIGLIYTDRTLRHSREVLEEARRSSSRQYDLAREEQITDRFIRATALLGATNQAERLGAIYSLERIMRESTIDQAAVVRLLCSFVRIQSPVRSYEELAPSRRELPESFREALELGAIPIDPTISPVSEDVQAAMTVLGRRPDRVEDFVLDLRNVDLSGAELRGADLRRADMRGANLTDAVLIDARLDEVYAIGSCFQYAYLNGASLRDADLAAANLLGAQLYQSKLRGATLRGAILEEANLGQADLRGSYLVKAILTRANLSGAHLEGAKLSSLATYATGLQEEQILVATFDGETWFPPAINALPSVQARKAANPAAGG